MDISSDDEPFADDEVVRGIYPDVLSDDGALVFVFEGVLLIDRTGDPGTERTGESCFPVGKGVNLMNSGGLSLRRCRSRNRRSGIIMSRI
jgi:hypothetical protein